LGASLVRDDSPLSKFSRYAAGVARCDVSRARHEFGAVLFALALSPAKRPIRIVSRQAERFLRCLPVPAAKNASLSGRLRSIPA
jgi:hypothetical protein